MHSFIYSDKYKNNCTESYMLIEAPLNYYGKPINRMSDCTGVIVIIFKNIKQ